jgi:hypothetical protein
MKRLSLLVVALMLSACATEAKYQQNLQSWVGQDELSLVRSWGPPARTYEVGGHKFFEYSREGNLFMPGTAPTYQTNVYGNTAYTNSYGGTPAMNIPLSCVTTFEVAEGRVLSGAWRGNNCTAK